MYSAQSVRLCVVIAASALMMTSPSSAFQASEWPVGKKVAIEYCDAGSRGCRTYSGMWEAYGPPNTRIGIMSGTEMIRTLSSDTPWHVCFEERDFRSYCWIFKGKVTLSPKVNPPTTIYITALRDRDFVENRAFVSLGAEVNCKDRTCTAERQIRAKRINMNGEAQAAAICRHYKLGAPLDWDNVNTERGKLSMTVDCLQN
jgi:hypothetical protein